VEPALFAAVDKDVLTDIVEMVEEGINRRKKPMGARRKALLIALLYDEFQKTGHLPDKSTVLGFIDMV
jgi:hypothetical protein